MIRVEEDAPNTGVFEFAFTMAVMSSFEAWQERNFSLPEEAKQAGPLVDADFDGVPNVVEYAIREENGEPTLPLPWLAQDASGRLIVSIDVRDDDPNLSVWFETSGDMKFTTPAGVTDESFPLAPLNLFPGIETDLGQGMKRVTLPDSDPVILDRKFIRAVVDVAQ